MKTERRHELMHNELADKLEAAMSRLLPYSRVIAGLLAALALLFLAYTWTNTSRQEQVETAWNRLLEAQSSVDQGTELKSIVKEYSRQPVAVWAEVALADTQLNDGLQALYRDRDLGVENLKVALETYQQIAKSSEPILAQRGLLGVARAQESLGDLEAATKSYQQLVDKDASGTFAEAAKQRITSLKRPSTAEFYEWLAKYTPPAPSPSVNFSKEPGTPGVGPSLNDSLDKPKSSSALDDLLSQPRSKSETTPATSDPPADAAPETAAPESK